MKWEYLVIDIIYFEATKITSILNKKGEQGWELVGLFNVSETKAYFKREIKDKT